jgi:FlaA1/EpsC-like NDP-sugar epimerase
MKCTRRSTVFFEQMARKERLRVGGFVNRLQEISNMQRLVTGGTGKVGAQVVRELQKRKAEISKGAIGRP